MTTQPRTRPMSSDLDNEMDAEEFEAAIEAWLDVVLPMPERRIVPFHPAKVGEADALNP